MPQVTVFLRIHPNPNPSKIPLKVPESGTPLGLFLKELCDLVNINHALYESEVSVLEDGKVISAVENGITHAMPGDVLQIELRKTSSTIGHPPQPVAPRQSPSSSNIVIESPEFFTTPKTRFAAVPKLEHSPGMFSPHLLQPYHGYPFNYASQSPFEPYSRNENGQGYTDLSNSQNFNFSASSFGSSASFGSSTSDASLKRPGNPAKRYRIEERHDTFNGSPPTSSYDQEMQRVQVSKKPRENVNNRSVNSFENDDEDDILYEQVVENVVTNAQSEPSERTSENRRISKSTEQEMSSNVEESLIQAANRILENKNPEDFPKPGNKQPDFYSSASAWILNEIMPVMVKRKDTKKLLVHLLNNGSLEPKDRNEQPKRTLLVNVLNVYLYNFWEPKAIQLVSTKLRVDTVKKLFEAFPKAKSDWTLDEWTNSARNGFLDNCINNSKKRGSSTWDLQSVKQRYPNEVKEKSSRLFVSRGMHRDEMWDLITGDNEQMQINRMKEISTLSTRNAAHRKIIIEGFHETQLLRRKMLDTEIRRKDGDNEFVGVAAFLVKNFPAVQWMSDLIHDDFLYWIKKTMPTWKIEDINAKWLIIKNNALDHAKSIKEELEEQANLDEYKFEIAKIYEDLLLLKNTRHYEDECDYAALQVIATEMKRANRRFIRMRVTYNVNRFMICHDKNVSINALNDSMKMALGRKTLRSMASQNDTGMPTTSSAASESPAIASASLNVVELRQPYILRIENDANFTYAFMLDGIAFYTDQDFIGTVRLAMEMVYVCNVSYDLQTLSLWNFFEELLGINTISSKNKASIEVVAAMKAFYDANFDQKRAQFKAKFRPKLSYLAT